MTVIEELKQRRNLLSVSGASTRIGKHREMVLRWVCAGHLAAIRVGQGYGIDPVVLAEFLEERKTA
jgi:hypothetical protein